MKLDLSPPQGVEIYIASARRPRRKRWPSVTRLLLLASAMGGIAYFLAQASLIVILGTVSAIVLVIVGLVRVAAWSLDNSFL